MSKKKATLLVPESDLFLPLAQRQFPYRAAPTIQVGETRAQIERIEANQAISHALGSMRNMIWRLIRESSNGRPLYEVDDLAAETMAHLCLDSLPRYDRNKCIKVSTFIYSCASRFIFKNIHKRRCTTEPLRDDIVSDCRANFNPSLLANSDAPKIDHAMAILRSPADYLDPVHARVISEYADGVPVKTIAQHVTKSRASVHRIFRSACARIRKLSESAELREYAT